MFFLVVVFSVCLLVPKVEGHGRLREPPSRASMWRDGFDNPTNYNDNELFCGGFQYQVRMGYKCGMCGDPYDQTRHHEAGGTYANGIIARTYTASQQIEIGVEITAAHKGWFQFKLCNNNDVTRPITQECLDEHVLELEGGRTKFYMGDAGPQWFTIKAKLPEGLTCTQCVLQWRYHTGNSWGTDSNGTSCIGCGYQEEFYGCSDVAITLNGATPSVPPSNNRTTTPSGSTSIITTTATSSPTATLPSSSPLPTSACAGYRPTPEFRHRPGMTRWCNENCRMGYCPPSHCECIPVDEQMPAAGSLAMDKCGTYVPTYLYRKVPGMAKWCLDTCSQGVCPASRCTCVP